VDSVEHAEQRHARRGRRAFTLVELLVVVGVIAVLVGLLMPALGAARNQSRSVQCLSNLRQIGMAALMYAQDTKQWVSFVPAVPGPPPKPAIDRKELLYPYLYMGKDNLDLSDRDVWTCPANTRPEEETSYGFNTKLNGVRIARIRRSSETVAIVDAGLKDQPLFAPSTATHCWSPGTPSTPSSCRPNHLRHPRLRVSVAFVDGHGEAMIMEPPFYPGPAGSYTPNGLTNVHDPNYQDTLWDLD
jgi:prepilin-type N-terminal cleavage/methylation domain-containing protein